MSYIRRVVCLMLVLAFVLLCGCSKIENSAEESSTTETTVDPNAVVAEISVASVGDILIHTPILEGALQSDGTYDFSAYFSSIKPIISGADFAVANYEGSLAESDYSGYPRFRTPDTIIDALKDCGFDFLVTANNHSNDGRFEGMKRTAQVIRDKGLGQTGTKADLSQKNYEVVSVKGINIGIMNYNYTYITAPNSRYINGVQMATEAQDYINSYVAVDEEKMISEMTESIAAMKDEGADVIMCYIHWGNEYKIAEDKYQREMGQKLCDLGVDVIIGGHPHVIEPATTFTSTVDGHKTFCIYSTGNFISNQRTSRMRLKTGHTEDGVVVFTNFTKYGSGEVKLTSVSYVPTWVDLHTESGKKIWEIMPLDDLSAITRNKSAATKSKERTDDLLKAGFEEYTV